MMDDDPYRDGVRSACIICVIKWAVSGLFRESARKPWKYFLVLGSHLYKGRFHNAVLWSPPWGLDSAFFRSDSTLPKLCMVMCCALIRDRRLLLVRALRSSD